MRKQIIGLISLLPIAVTAISPTFAAENGEMEAIRSCIPETQGRLLVSEVNVLGTLKTGSGTLYHAALLFEGRKSDVEGEVVILQKTSGCERVYESQYWGGTQDLAEVFDQATARQIAFQWIAHKVDKVGRDVIQKSLYSGPATDIPDYYLWAYKKLGFTVPGR